MNDFGERATSGTRVDTDLAVIKRATRLLAEDPRTVRRNLQHINTKFPKVELTSSTPDFNRHSGTGSRVSYLGTIDRATRDAMPDFYNDDTPFVTLESGADQVIIPVVPREPMVTDDEAIALMPLTQRERAAEFAGNILAGLQIE